MIGIWKPSQQAKQFKKKKKISFFITMLQPKIFGQIPVKILGYCNCILRLSKKKSRQSENANSYKS